MHLEVTKAPSRAAAEQFRESLIAVINPSFGPLLHAAMAALSYVCVWEVHEENPHYKHCGECCSANVTSPTE